jgi:hypothetical protein
VKKNDLIFEKLKVESEKVGIKLMTNATLSAIVDKRDAGELSQSNALAFSDILDEAEEAALKKVGEAVE